MLIQSLKLKNLLSFGERSQEITLQNLNVLIGANASGKTNFVEALALLKSTGQDIVQHIVSGGGVAEWIRKGSDTAVNAELEAVFCSTEKTSAKNSPYLARDIRYNLEFLHENEQFFVKKENIETKEPTKGNAEPFLYYNYTRNRGSIINKRETQEEKGKQRHLEQDIIDPRNSILSQRKDPDSYPELSYISSKLNEIKLYRNWDFGRNAEVRKPQRPDLPTVYLNEDGSNLGLVLNHLSNNYKVRSEIVKELQIFNKNILDFNTKFEGGYFQVHIQENTDKNPIAIPATRLSDGTLRYLSLLAILLHPDPPPLVCIEEPELSMHPDIIPRVAELLVQASKNGESQIIVTTHSIQLVDALNKYPDSILITEKYDTGTEITRFDKEEHKEWLREFRLGELWTRGYIGGNS